VEELEPRWLPAVSQLAFLTAPPTLTAGTASGLITLQLEDAGGNAATALGNTTFALSTTRVVTAFGAPGSAWSSKRWTATAR
jgi:hypothetical protein